MKAHAVIGAWWGDEGKGLMTDYLAAQYESPLVVRFNGGSQAGHTVVTPDGMRHVFHHFGSGTLIGAPTYLSEFFVVNPYIFQREYEELAKLGVTPMVAIDLNAPVTTPYDMAFNQEIEKLRGDNRHGSVGLGIHCTIERNNRIPFDWGDVLGGRTVFPEIKKYYLELAEQGWDMDLKKHPAFYDSTEEIYWDTVAFMRDAVHRAHPELGYDHIIFEGAQGLMLDPEYGEMPHCTPSSCGFRNVRYLADKMGVEQVNAVYVSRSYATRHGNGPLPGEPIEPQEDITNVDHEYQGSLRFSRLQSANHKVLKDFVGYMRCRDSFSMVVTHLDQYDDGNWKFFEDSVKYKSYGPTRNDVVAV